MSDDVTKTRVAAHCHVCGAAYWWTAWQFDDVKKVFVRSCNGCKATQEKVAPKSKRGST